MLRLGATLLLLGVTVGLSIADAVNINQKHKQAKAALALAEKQAKAALALAEKLAA